MAVEAATAEAVEMAVVAQRLTLRRIGAAGVLVPLPGF